MNTQTGTENPRSNFYDPQVPVAQRERQCEAGRPNVLTDNGIHIQVLNTDEYCQLNTEKRIEGDKLLWGIKWRFSILTVLLENSD